MSLENGNNDEQDQIAREQRAYDLWIAEQTISEIAKQLGYPEDTVCQDIRREADRRWDRLGKW